VPGITALCVDLGGSHATCALVNDGSILANRGLPADRLSALSNLLPILSETFENLLGSANIDLAVCTAIVFGFCGVVSARENRIVATNEKYSDATNVDLTAWGKREFGLPVLLENDARLALLAEHRYGAARGVQDAVMVTIGTGIGGSAMLGGNLLQSRHGLAGTIGGHFPVSLNGRRCSCGNRGCAEALASTAFLSEIYREQTGSKDGLLSDRNAIGFFELFNAVDAGDKPAIAALEHCLHVWSVLTVALIHAYDPEVVIFGGSALKRAAKILPPLQDYVTSYAWTQGRTIPLLPADLGPDAALLGAIPLIEANQ
jgi:glucokinase